MAQKQNITLDQGATFSTSFLFQDTNGDPIDYSPYTANSQMRKSYSSSTAYDFTVAMVSNGQVTLSMTANTTNSITAGRYVYDVEVQSPAGLRTRLVEGIVTVTPQVTR